MPLRTGIKIPDETLPYIEQYQKMRGLKSRTAALLELAAIGIREVFNIGVGTPAWGGDRKSQEYLENIKLELEHIEIKMLGLPPLGDDDAA